MAEIEAIAANANETLGACTTALVPLASAAELPAVTSHAFGRAHFAELACGQTNAIELNRRQVDAVFALERARVGALQPAVPLPTQPIRRDNESKKHNRYGVIVGSEEHRDAVNRSADIDHAAESKKRATQAAFWGRHRRSVLEAEAALVKEGDMSKLSVGHLKSIVISRTGHPAKAKNNKEGALLAEATAAASAHPATRMPAPPPLAADGGLAGTADGGGACAPGGQADAWACADCHIEYAEGGLPEPDENEHFWCECGGRINSTD
jgi:hypothetical protein